jgi:hypothetical protein
MVDNLREAFEKALEQEGSDAFHIAFKAGFRAAEFRDGEYIGTVGHAPPATDVEIGRIEEKALRSAPAE